MHPEPLPQFFEGYFRELIQQQWPAVVLHSWQPLPEHIASDVDYLVAGVSPDELTRFLNNYCHRKGWQLVQVMEHEPQAYYAVCVMDAAPWSSLQLDVTWDYRRKGRLLLAGAWLLEGRRTPPGKSFQVPAAAAEFAYVFAKGLAKSKGASPVLERLAELWLEDPAGCRKALQSHFSVPVADFAFPTSTIIAALDPENRCFSRWRTRQWGFSQISWLLKRLRAPYGITLALAPTVDPEQVGAALLAAFRKVQVVTNAPGFFRRRLYEFRSGLTIGGPSLRGAAGVIDLTAEPTAEASVGAALRHLHKRCRIRHRLSP